MSEERIKLSDAETNALKRMNEDVQSALARVGEIELAKYDALSFAVSIRARMNQVVQDKLSLAGVQCQSAHIDFESGEISAVPNGS